MNDADYYAVLGVAPHSDDVVIRAAFKALMLKYHPDTNRSPDATARAASINAAFGVLGDREKRTAYDAGRAKASDSGKSDRATPPPPPPSSSQAPKAEPEPVAELRRNGSISWLLGGTALLGLFYYFFIAHSNSAVTPAAFPRSSLSSTLGAQYGAQDENIDTAQPSPFAGNDRLNKASTGVLEHDDAPISVDTFRANLRPFVHDYFAATSANDALGVAFITRHYANSVKFFSSDTAKADVVAQKLDYMRRWPERSYIPDEHMLISCKTVSVCTISGTIRFEARSLSRNAYARGRSTFTLELELSDADILITGENSKVIKRF